MTPRQQAGPRPQAGRSAQVCQQPRAGTAHAQGPRLHPVAPHVAGLQGPLSEARLPGAGPRRVRPAGATARPPARGGPFSCLSGSPAASPQCILSP